MAKHDPDSDRSMSSPSEATPRTPKKAKKSKDALVSQSKEGWSVDRRLKLFDAYNKHSNINWESVAAELNDGSTAKMCREQWQRGTSKKIKEALVK